MKHLASRTDLNCDLTGISMSNALGWPDGDDHIRHNYI